MGKTLFIDGDILLYKIGFSVETRQHKVKDLETGEVSIVKSKKEIKDNFHDIPIDIKTEQIFNCDFPKLECAVRLDRLIKKIYKNSKCDNYYVCLSDENGTFRSKECKKIKYKENRVGLLKPLLFDFLLNRIKQRFDILTMDGLEADDVLGINSGPNTVIASIDKDLLMVPGKHYNINTDDITDSRDPGTLWLYKNKAGSKRIIGYGFMWFCAQMLLGDQVDNIPGINRYGPVKVFKSLAANCNKQDMWDMVCNIYDEHKKSDWIEETARMLWILRKENDTYKDWL